jgi:hypothetical protein
VAITALVVPTVPLASVSAVLDLPVVSVANEVVVPIAAAVGAWRPRPALGFRLTTTITVYIAVFLLPASCFLARLFVD